MERWKRGERWVLAAKKRRNGTEGRVRFANGGQLTSEKPGELMIVTSGE